MILLAVNALASYASWGIVSAFIPVVRAGSRTWRLPAWGRVLAISGISYGLYGVPPRYVHALACGTVVLFLMMAALKLGAVLPGPYNISLPARPENMHPEHPPARQEMQGYSPATGGPGRRVPRLD